MPKFAVKIPELPLGFKKLWKFNGEFAQPTNKYYFTVPSITINNITTIENSSVYITANGGDHIVANVDYNYAPQICPYLVINYNMHDVYAIYPNKAATPNLFSKPFRLSQIGADMYEGMLKYFVDCVGYTLDEYKQKGGMIFKEYPTTRFYLFCSVEYFLQKCNGGNMIDCIKKCFGYDYIPNSNVLSILPLTYKQEYKVSMGTFTFNVTQVNPIPAKVT